jgi:hypothetical protein
MSAPLVCRLSVAGDEVQLLTGDSAAPPTAEYLCCGAPELRNGRKWGTGSIHLSALFSHGPVILATWEAEVRRIVVPGQPRKIFCENSEF